MSQGESPEHVTEVKLDAPAASDVERCPLCPPDGPPQPTRTSQPDSSTALTPTPEVDLVWIACTKCSTWYHSACLLLEDERVRSTIPDGIVQEVETNHQDEGAWFDWTIWVDQWYCIECLDKVNSPSNPRPPRHPLVAKLKRRYPPFEVPKSKNKRKSLPVASPQQTPSTKRARTSTEADIVPSAGAELKVNDAEASSSTPIADGTPAPEGEQTPSEGRPKRNVKQLDYHNLNNSIATPTSQWLELIANPAKYGRVILDAEYKHVPGKILSKTWLESDPSAHPKYPPSMFYGPNREPIVVGPADGGFSGMGGSVPGKDLTVQDVARLVGPQKMVDVIDVASQQSSQWTLQRWADYLSSSANGLTASESKSRSNKIYNIISLEISDTELGRRVKPPRLVREIDWVDNFWNFASGVKEKGKGKAKENGSNGHVKEEQVHQDETIDAQSDRGEEARAVAKAPYPKVQLYCLMGMKGAWTDWHVDFAASSVYYTIHTGSKVFYFIKPTPRNLKAYTEWSGSYEKQQDTWLGDMVDEVRKVVLKAGDTMIIPAGYIHAVYTPLDSIVFGGNFIHSYDIDTQLKLRQIEIDTKVPQRFRFPMFEKLCWFVADRYVTSLRQYRAYRPRATSPPHAHLPHRRVLENLVYLADFLISQIAILHNPAKEDKSKKLVYDRIPHDVVKDAEGLARELKWRVLRELGEESALEGGSVLGTGNLTAHNEKELKKKKIKLGQVFEKKPVSRTWKFDPPEWAETIHPAQVETSIQKLSRPNSGAGTVNASRFYPMAPEEEAEVTTSLVKQVRRRVREFHVDQEHEHEGGPGGGVVLEEQEVTFVERKVVWGASGSTERAQKMEVD